MLITKTSPFTGITHSMELDITEEQIHNHKHGMFIQKAMPNLTPDEREFYMTGVTKDEWDNMFKDSEMFI